MPKRLIPRTAIALSLYLLVLVAAAGVAVLWVSQQDAARDREDARKLRAAAVASCERVSVKVNEIVRTLKLVTAGDDEPDTDIGRRLFAAIDALQEQSPRDCIEATP